MYPGLFKKKIGQSDLIFLRNWIASVETGVILPGDKRANIILVRYKSHPLGVFSSPHWINFELLPRRFEANSFLTLVQIPSGSAYMSDHIRLFRTTSSRISSQSLTFERGSSPTRATESDTLEKSSFVRFFLPLTYYISNKSIALLH